MVPPGESCVQFRVVDGLDMICGGWFMRATVKPLVKVAISVPVVIVTLRVPTAAPGSMFNTAVALVAELTVSEVTEMAGCDQGVSSGSGNRASELGSAGKCGL